MKKNLIAALLAALLLCSCVAESQFEQQPVPEESSVVEQPIQREEETESAQTESVPEIPVNKENAFPEEIADYLLAQYDPQTAEGETQEQLVERMWVLANNLYFADETFYSDWVEESDMQGPSQNRFIDFDDLTAHLFTEAGKEELLSAQVGGGPYITERDGEYYHLGAWRTEPYYQMEDYQLQEEADDRLVLQVNYYQEGFDGERIQEGTAPMTLQKQGEIWLIDSFHSPNAKYPD